LELCPVCGSAEIATIDRVVSRQRVAECERGHRFTHMLSEEDLLTISMGRRAAA